MTKTNGRQAQPCSGKTGLAIECSVNAATTMHSQYQEGPLPGRLGISASYLDDGLIYAWHDTSMHLHRTNPDSARRKTARGQFLKSYTKNIQYENVK